MAGKSLGTLTIDLIAEVGGFVKGMDQAERAADKWRQNVIKDAAKVGTAFGAAVSAISAGTLSLIKSTSAHVTETDRWAKSLGISTSALMQWQYAAEKAGLSGDNISDIFKDLNDKIGDAVLNNSGQAAQALDTLGLSAKKLQTLSPDKQLLEISHAMQGMNKAQQTNIFESLGNDLTKLSPLLDNNAEKLKSLMQNATDLSIAPKDTDVEKLLRVNQVFQDISDNIDGFKNRFAIALSQIDLSPMQESLKNIQNVLTDPQTLNGMANLVDGALHLANFVTKVAAGLGNIAALTGSRTRAISGKYDQSDVNDVQKRLDYVQNSGNAQPGELEFLQKRLHFLNALKKAGDDINPGAGKGMGSLLAAMGINSGGDYKLGAGEHNQKVNTPKPKTDHNALRLDNSFKSTEQAYLRQISLIDTTGKKTAVVTEQQKLAFELSTGKLNGLNSAQQDRLKSLATEVDRLNQLKKANEDNAKITAYIATLQESNFNNKKGLDIDFIGAGMGDKTRGELKEIVSIRQEFNSQQLELNKQYSNDGNKYLYDKETSALNEAMNQRLSDQKNYYEKLDALQGDWLLGFGDGLRNSADESNNLYQQLGTFAQETYEGMSDALANFVLTGKANFRDFTRSVLSDIARISMQKALAGLVGGVFNSFSPIGASSNAAVSGMSAGSNAAVGGMGLSLNYSGYDGGGFTGNGGKYDPAGIVHKGEFVFTKEATSRIGVDKLYNMMRGYSEGGYVGRIASNTPTSVGQVSTGGVFQITAPVTLNIGSDNKRPSIDSDGMSRQLQSAMINVVNEQAMKQGTPLWRAIKGK
ncbi:MULTISPECIES: phage tail tape measure protein [unclassified Tatumella]|uniref:phage tail tape measure protein n=1 Tax=unclassified Tatumella TaxID=2649542 RepID=UPI001BAEACB0|nr:MULTISPECIES: phage tail tape measure protein [unclassified Tatumella]MBS0878592.1 phage tail tape measure protein [Tatumella sp. JGM82]MBS0892089.1 phage tail tape measure protein [Tatumella sp. JGM94]MBS0900868.1 phage tail tape measure protein [Tatumella sp. JGM100]